LWGNTEFLRARELTHPNIVRVLDAGLWDGSHNWFTMEHIEAVSLTQVKERWGVGGVLQVIAGAALALDYVHRRGFVHGDIKPSNILVTPTEHGPRTKVIDFGLSTTASPGQLKGTPAYMAPELLKDPTSTPCSDLYALGVSAYEALAGHNPFAASSVQDALQRQLNLTPLPLSQVPLSVAEVISRLLDKEPSARFASARALLFALSEAAPKSINRSAVPLPEHGVWVGSLQPLTQLQHHTTSPGLTWLQGDPGVGKTRVADELVVRLRLEGKRALLWPTPEALRADVLNQEIFVLEDLDRLPVEQARNIMVRLRRLAIESHVVLTVRRIPEALRGAQDNTVQVAALASDDVEALVCDLLDLSDRNAPVATSVAQACQGNPGLLHALLRSLHTHGVLRRSDGRWSLDPRLSPHGLLDTLKVRDLALPEPLPNELEYSLKRCAIAFAPWDATGLATLLGERVDTIHLERLVALGWLVRQWSGSYRFVCPAARRHWHAQLNPSERVRLHHQAAQTLARSDAAHEPNTLDRQAQHLWETGQHQRARTVMHQAMTRANHPHIQRIQLEWLIDRLDKPVDEGVLRLKAGDLWMRVGH
ncbi:MAG: serine/threonine-protein kinase, partial [Myxococcota bacterium]